MEKLKSTDTYFTSLFRMYEKAKYENLSEKNFDFSNLHEAISEVLDLRRKNLGLKRSLDNANEKLDKMNHYITGRKGIGAKNR